MTSLRGCGFMMLYYASTPQPVPPVPPPIPALAKPFPWLPLLHLPCSPLYIEGALNESIIF